MMRIGLISDTHIPEAMPELWPHVYDQFTDCDAILLAQFSTSIAHDAVSAKVRCPVLTSPGSAVAKMKRLMS